MGMRMGMEMEMEMGMRMGMVPVYTDTFERKNVCAMSGLEMKY